MLHGPHHEEDGVLHVFPAMGPDEEVESESGWRFIATQVLLVLLPAVCSTVVLTQLGFDQVLVLISGCVFAYTGFSAVIVVWAISREHKPDLSDAHLRILPTHVILCRQPPVLLPRDCPLQSHVMDGRTLLAFETDDCTELVDLEHWTPFEAAELCGRLTHSSGMGVCRSNDASWIWIPGTCLGCSRGLIGCALVPLAFVGVVAAAGASFSGLQGSVAVCLLTIYAVALGSAVSTRDTSAEPFPITVRIDGKGVEVHQVLHRQWRFDGRPRIDALDSRVELEGDGVVASLPTELPVVAAALLRRERARFWHES